MLSIPDSLFITEKCSNKLKLMESEFLSGLEGSSPLIIEMAAHIFGGGGKRVRPLFLLLVSEMLGYDGDDDVRIAVAVEYIHTATLVHDDIIDAAVSRRSRATLHSIYDSNLSILFGDYIFAQGISIINSFRNHKLMTVFSILTQDMIRGEILESENKHNINLSYDDYLKIIDFKTAELFGGCGQLGAIISDADDLTESAIRSAGLKFGMAFQFIDDLLDFDLDEGALGKPTFADLQDGKLTLPSFLLMESGAEGKKIVEIIMKEKGFISIGKEVLASAIDDRDIKNKVRKKAENLVLEALDLINMLPMNSAHMAIENLAGSFIKREH
jgi:octaprenyl-diphosphate synthase